MRSYAKQKDKEAKITANEPPNRRVRSITMDFSQNAELPTLNGEQPGDTYYLTPLIVKIFGISDAMHESDKLDAYVYSEADGKAGGNEVTSFFYTSTLTTMVCSQRVTRNSISWLTTAGVRTRIGW